MIYWRTRAWSLCDSQINSFPLPRKWAKQPVIAWNIFTFLLSSGSDKIYFLFSASQLPGHRCMDNLGNERTFDSQAMWVVDVLGLFFDMLSTDVCTTRHWQMYGRLVQELNVCTVDHRKSSKVSSWSSNCTHDHPIFLFMYVCKHSHYCWWFALMKYKLYQFEPNLKYSIDENDICYN